MELDRLEKAELKGHPNDFSYQKSGKPPTFQGIELAYHTDEELRNIEYVPGKTLEEIQGEKGHKHSHKHHTHHHGKHHSGGVDHSTGIQSGGDKTKDKRKFKILVNNYRIILRLLIFLYQICHAAYLVLYIAPIFSNPFVEWMIKVATITFFGTMVYNYWQTAQVSSLSFKRKKQKSFLSNKEYKECEKCNHIWKPTRTHHCSVQAHDVLRMDHYCPVTLNTIGMRNHGAFFMTGLYHLICCLFWMVLYFVYACYQLKPLIRTGIWRTCWMIVLGFADYLIVASLAGLSVGIVASHIPYIINNRTTLEGYGESTALTTDLRKGRLWSSSRHLQPQCPLQPSAVLLGSFRPSAVPRSL